jgi:hypothetical protein
MVDRVVTNLTKLIALIFGIWLSYFLSMNMATVAGSSVVAWLSGVALAGYILCLLLVVDFDFVYGLFPNIRFTYWPTFLKVFTVVFLLFFGWLVFCIKMFTPRK